MTRETLLTFLPQHDPADDPAFRLTLDRMSGAVVKMEDVYPP